MLRVPATTEFDLRFRLLGIPVRVHPFFWLVTAILGGLGRQGFTIQMVLIWVGCAFVSILVHEYGHGLMARAFGSSPSIVLYGMGGLCVSEGERGPWRRLAVLICGPSAGFLLAGLIFAGHWASGSPPLSGWKYQIYRDMLYINLAWGLVNLLPIWPLDGGQMSSVILTMFNRRQGVRWSHIVSLLVAGSLAVAAWKYTNGDLFLTAFFAFFALTNFQILQMLHYQEYAGHGVEDDADWWKR